VAWKHKRGISALCDVLDVSEGDYRYAKSPAGRIYIEKPFVDPKSGKTRALCYPPDKSKLRMIQQRIKERILADIPLLRQIRGYRPKCHNINTAADVSGSLFMGKVDISKFHPSITPQHVAWALREHGFSPSWAREIANIVTYKGCVPQGAPTSNHIANLVMDSLLRRVIKPIADKLGVAFINFGDDIAFYGDNLANVRACVAAAKRAFREFGFRSSDEKCLDGEHRGGKRQFIGCATGRDNPDYPRIKYRDFRRELRALIQAERMRCAPEPLTTSSDLNSIKHRIAYIKRLNPRKVRRLLDDFYRLCAARRSSDKPEPEREPEDIITLPFSAPDTSEIPPWFAS